MGRGPAAVGLESLEGERGAESKRKHGRDVAYSENGIAGGAERAGQEDSYCRQGSRSN